MREKTCSHLSAGRKTVRKGCDQLATQRLHSRLYPAKRSPRMGVSSIGEPALQLDDRLKNLLRELGHAINDTVSESDRITGAIAGVRAHGYDIVLKLDATIGLAKREGESKESSLTSLDRRFLESLRIQVDQESLQEAEVERRPASRLTMTPQDVRFLKSLRIATDDIE